MSVCLTLGASPDSGGGTHEFLNWVASRRLKYSIGFNPTEEICAAILAPPQDVRQVAYDAGGQIRDGAWVAELTGMLDLASWPKGMRLIVRKDAPTPALNRGSPFLVGPVRLSGKPLIGKLAGSDKELVQLRV